MKKIINFLFFAFFIASCGQKVAPEWVDLSSRLPFRVQVVLSGDFMQHLPQVNAARTDSGFDYDTQLGCISSFWQSADFAVINLETTLTFGANYSGYPLFRAPSQIAFALRRAGISHAVLANNHAVDRGGVGVRETLSALDSAGIYHTGLYLDTASSDQILMLRKGEFSIALLNYTYSINGNVVPRGMVVGELDTALIARHLVEARRLNATHIILYLHWGDEYSTIANEGQRKLALWARSRGASVVVGSHPHVAQQIDMQNKIVYSLGNFVSNQRQKHTNAGLSVRLTFYKGVSEPRIQFLPHFVDVSSVRANERYRVLTPRDGDAIENAAARSAFDLAIEDVRKVVATEVKYE